MYENVSVAQIVNLQHQNQAYRPPNQQQLVINQNHNCQHYPASNRNEAYDRTGGYDVPRSLGNNYYVNAPQNGSNMRQYIDFTRSRCPSVGNNSSRQRSFDDTESCYYSHYSQRFYENMYEKVREEPFYQNASTSNGNQNLYGRLDIIGHGIGRIERHRMSSSCNNIDHYNVLGRSHVGGAVGQIQFNNSNNTQSQNFKDASSAKDMLSKAKIFGCLSGENSQSMNSIFGNENAVQIRGNGGTSATNNSSQSNSSANGGATRNTGAIPKIVKNKVGPKPLAQQNSGSNNSSTQANSQQQNSFNRITKSSLQYLLIQKLPLWIGGSAPDYKIVDFNFMFNRNERNQELVRFNGEASIVAPSSREYPSHNYPRIIKNIEPRMSHLKECEESNDNRGQNQENNNQDPFRNWSFNFENNTFRPACGSRFIDPKDAQEQKDIQQAQENDNSNSYDLQPSSSKSSSPSESDNSAHSIASMRSLNTEMKKSENYDNLASLQETLPNENLSNDTITIEDDDEQQSENEFQLDTD